MKRKAGNVMKKNFLYITNLQYEVKSLRAQVAALESGEAYRAMKAELMQQLRAEERRHQSTKQELADSRRAAIRMRNNWMQVNEDVVKEYEKQIQVLMHRLDAMEKRALKAEGACDEWHDKCNQKQQELYQVQIQLEEEQGKNQKLIAQINRDYENSAIPSTGRENFKKICNSREKTGRKPGGQPGHKGHRRNRLEPTQIPIFLEAPKTITSNPDFYPTGKEIRKQVVDVKMLVTVTEYVAMEYRNRKTGSRYHAPFPDGVENDVNYGSGVKGLSYFLNNYCNVSIEKTREFLSGVSDGEINLSTGMINNLGRKLSAKTEADRRRIFASLLLSPVMYTDNTVGRVNGEKKAVVVCASEHEVLYFFKEQKGHKGIKGTPVADYQHTLVHDHDKTFYHYGGSHQECLAHVLRYLKDSIDNEPDRAWNKEMHSFLQKLIHEVKTDRGIGEEKCLEYEAEYGEILEKAREDYEYVPPSDYYREGFNLQKRLYEYQDSHLFFLRHPEVDYTNNRSERYCRKYKRKQKQAVTFRSSKSGEDYCNVLGIIETGKLKGQSAYQTIKTAFE